MPCTTVPSYQILINLSNSSSTTTCQDRHGLDWVLETLAQELLKLQEILMAKDRVGT